MLIAGTLMTFSLSACDDSNNESGQSQTGENTGGDPPEGEPGGPGGGPGDPGGGSGGPGGGPGSSSTDIDYKGSREVKSAETLDGDTISSTTADESALLMSTSEAVTVSNVTVTKSGDSDGGDNCNFYGLNAAVLVKDGSTTTITGANITSNAEGAT